MNLGVRIWLNYTAIILTAMFELTAEMNLKSKIPGLIYPVRSQNNISCILVLILTLYFTYP
ncbi:MAG: hypothetical protein AN484_15780 [Aphanizomenon flos-aquae WA102]|uniref:Uncharacterized protein n=1 Tax=Aphanizomenon flos-aquae WA102 TaxID=1710896 RepID=A0A1B7X0A5_APHFL|nr:MAG: hypothetical protein AN484_15780 [Aphanizomenon flos-aquae WA102]